jgi:hypothetical protein
MRVCIHRRYLGTDRHLLLEGDRSLWSRSIPDDHWVLDTEESDESPRDIRFLSRFLDAQIDWEMPAPFLRADEEAGVDATRHIHTVPRKALQDHVCRLLRDAETLADRADDSYIISHLLSIRRQLGDVCGMRVDRALWDEAMSSDPSPQLASFEPDDTGMCEPIRYDQIGTITGRLTVSHGPQILTLRRDHRRILQPTRRGRRLLMVDFVSHEPRVALCLAGRTPPEDIYSWFRDEMMPGITRDQAKSAIIGTLYGMSASTLAEKLDCAMVQAKIVSESVRVAFGLVDLERKITAEHRATGRVMTHFGRSIRPSSSIPGVLVNAHIQGTAHDAAMAGFREILSRLASEIVEVRAGAYIHDAVILDIPERDEGRLRDACAEAVKIDGLQGYLLPKVKEVTE